MVQKELKCVIKMEKGMFYSKQKLNTRSPKKNE